MRPSVSERWYGALLRLFPFDFRAEYGAEMEEVFREQHADARRAGPGRLLRLWWETAAGIFQTAPREHVSMLQQDTRYALRMMRRNPGYTAMAVLTLALGIGCNTAIVSVIHAVLLRPLPYHDDRQLVMLHQSVGNGPRGDIGFSVAEMNDYRRATASFASLAEYHSMRFTLFSGDQATRVRAGVVSPDFFRMFGVQPVWGRDFVAADDLPSAPAVLLLSYEYWKEHCGGDPKIVGKTFEMNDRVHTVIGVLPLMPQYPNVNDVYMPSSDCPFRSSRATIENRERRMVNLFARLKPGVSLWDSQSDLQSAAQRMEREHPATYGHSGLSATSGLLRDELTEDARPALLVLLGAAACVLLIACANVANLILARMTSRERELSVRAALGAGKARLFRQLVTESFLMGALASLLGLLFASLSLKLLMDFTARLTSRASEIHLDASMLAFALLLAFATSIVFGSVSALSSRSELASGLKDGPPLTAGRRRSRARKVLVVCQVAFSFVLLIGAGLMLRSFRKLQGVESGFAAPDRVVAVKLDLNWSKYDSDASRRDFGNRLLRIVEAQPGVRSAAIASSYPLDPDTLGGGWNERFVIEGRPTRPDEAAPLASMRVVTPGYFQTLGIGLLEGRTFAPGDGPESPGVLVINESLARNHQVSQGRRLSMDGGQSWARVIGIVRDVREFGPDRAVQPEIYMPQAQNPAPHALLVRTGAGAAALGNQFVRAVRQVDPQTAIPTVETLEQARSDAVASPRLITSLLGVFAALALVIAAAGIGGMLALAVSQRVNEIGIRVAMGARPRDVAALVLGQGMGLVVVGLLLGLAVALALTRLMSGLLFQIAPTDAFTFTGVSAVLAATALIACSVPARRASRIDPAVALRKE